VDAQTKLSVVASDIFGVSGRAMLAALLAGERDPKRLAQLARTRLRAKLGPLTEAFCGFFTDQHAFLLAKMLARVDALDADLAELDAKLAELIACFAEAVDRLDEIPGIGQTAAHLPIVELGRDTGQVPDRRAPGVMGPSSPLVSRSPPADAGAADRPGTATRIWLGCSARPPASTTPASVQSAPSTTTSASSKPSATRSPSTPLPDRPSPDHSVRPDRIRARPGHC
jgi:hypothetical protein